MNASAGRGENGTEMIMNVVKGGGRGMRLVGLGDKRVLVREAEQPEPQAGEVNEQVGEDVWRSFRTMIDRLDGPFDEARSLAMFGRVMRRLSEQQDTELRWRWVRRVATALAAAAGAGAVRMLSR